MAKKAVLQREKKRMKLVEQYKTKRKEIKAALRVAQIEGAMDVILELQQKLQKLPRDSAPTRQQRRCVLTGRAHAVERKFELCHSMIRVLMGEGFIPGLVMSSW